MVLQCPRCSQPIRRHELKGLEAWTCRRCGGALVSGTVEAALEAASRPASGMQPVVGAVALEAVDVAKPLVCPACQEPLWRHTVLGIVVDTCDRHGTWYDRGELRQLVFRLRARAAAPAGVGVVASAVMPAPIQHSPAGSGAGDVAAIAVEGAAELTGEVVLEFLGDVVGGILS